VHRTHFRRPVLCFICAERREPLFQVQLRKWIRQLTALEGAVPTAKCVARRRACNERYSSPDDSALECSTSSDNGLVAQPTPFRITYADRPVPLRWPAELGPRGPAQVSLPRAPFIPSPFVQPHPASAPPRAHPASLAPQYGKLAVCAAYTHAVMPHGPHMELGQVQVVAASHSAENAWMSLQLGTALYSPIQPYQQVQVQRQGMPSRALQTVAMPRLPQPVWPVGAPPAPCAVVPQPAPTTSAPDSPRSTAQEERDCAAQVRPRPSAAVSCRRRPRTVSTRVASHTLCAPLNRHRSFCC